MAQAENQALYWYNRWAGKLQTAWEAWRDADGDDKRLAWERYATLLRQAAEDD